MKSYPKVSIIIPTAIFPKIIYSCLHSIAKLDYPQNNIEIIIVNNAAPQTKILNLTKKYPGVKIVHFAKNHGFAQAINTGAREARNAYLCIANDDVLFEKHSLKLLITHLRNKPNIGTCGPTIISKNNQFASCGYSMNFWTGSVRSLQKNETPTPDWVQGCCLMIKKSLFLQLHGFDESFDHFFEDTDLCLRIKNIGLQIACVANARIMHKDSTTANQNLSRKYYLWYKNKIRLMYKHFSPAQILTNSVFHFCLFIYYLVTNNPRSFALSKASLWSFISLPKLIQTRYAS
ncbi:glycosyltransferase family 2 protein [Candidatus Microgenomates bacterium]|nr:MAG: glycosyltransferase family 2 protein [Candidatus Microgenomates bacterium]